MEHSNVMKKAKEVYKCLHTLESSTGGRAKLVKWDECTFNTLSVELYPEEGPFRGGAFTFELNLEEYPDEPPHVTYTGSGLLHPNIDVSGEVCFNLLEDGTWESDTHGLDTVIVGLLFLLYNPNFDDPLWTPDEGWGQEEKGVFERNVARAMQGEENVMGYNFKDSCIENPEEPLAGQPCVADCAGRGLIPQMELVSKVTSGLVNILEEMEVESDDQPDKPVLRHSQTILPSQSLLSMWNPQALPQVPQPVQEVPSLTAPELCNTLSPAQNILSANEVNQMPTFGQFPSNISNNSIVGLRRTQTWHPAFGSS